MLPKKTKKIIDEVTRTDEPIFIIRANDKLSIEILFKYLQTATNAECDREFLEDMLNVISNFQSYQQVNKTKIKIPD